MPVKAEKSAPDQTHWNRMEYSADNCSMIHALDIVGDKWALPILRESFFGLRRFSQFQSVLGCARNLLSARLAKLVEYDLLKVKSYQVPGQRQRQEYLITPKGKDLLPVLVALLRWGDKWAVDPKGPPILLKHRGCDASVDVFLRCDCGHADLATEDLEVSEGPGAIKLI
jgi:DNA-binding HxlR family transcriptional regulator